MLGITLQPVKITKTKNNSNKNQWDIAINNIQCGRADCIYKTRTQRTWDIHFDTDLVPDFANNIQPSYTDNHTINKGLQLALKDLADYKNLKPGAELSENNNSKRLVSEWIKFLPT